jgi:uncharacterized protein (TIGR02246 family)
MGSREVPVVKRIALTVLALAVLLGATSCATTGLMDPAAFRVAIEETGSRYCAACLSGDVNAYLANWDADGVQYPPDAPMNIGTAAIAKRMEAAFARVKFLKFEINLIEARQLTPTIGYSSGNYWYDFVLTSGGPTTRFEGKDLALYRKQADGSWKIFHDCFNSNVAKP